MVTRAIDKIFEKNLRFHVNCCSRGEVQYLDFSNFLLVLTIFSFWEKDRTLDYNSIWDVRFFLSLMSFGNSSVNSHLTFLLVITTFCFTCGEKHLVIYLQGPKISEMALMGHGTFNSNKIYFVLIT